MKHNFRKAMVGLAVGSVTLMGVTGTAGATDSIPNSGQDNVNDIVTIGGSDTTYVVETEIARLYNQSPGCNTQNTFGALPTIATCLSPNNQAPASNLGNNWDHDVITSIYPTGSGAGINAVIGGFWDMARSSRVLTLAELGSQNAWGFAKDGIVVATPPGRTITSLTKAQVIGVFNCTITTWNQITGNPADTGTIRPYGVNGSSGTYGSFRSFVGFDPNAGACVNKLGTGVAAFYAFENDFKPVLADATAKGFVTSDILTWGSFAELKNYPYKSQGVSFWPLDSGTGVVAPQTSTIANDSYGITRIVNRVTPNATAGLAAGNAANVVLATTGATTGKTGAARRYTEWACQPLSYFGSTAAPNPNVTLDPYTGFSYYEEITAAIVGSGFQRVPAAQRNAGACQVQQ